MRGGLILGGSKVTLNQGVEEASHVDPGAPGANGKCKGPAAGAPLPTPGMLRLDGAPQWWSGVPAGQRHPGVKTLHL